MLNTWLDANQPSEAVANFARTLAGIAEMDASGANRAVLEIMHSILEAEGEEAVFEAANAGTLGGKTFVDIPFRLRADGVEWKKSAAMFREQGGFPFYAVQRITRLDNGQDAVLTCGGFTYITTLYALIQKGFMDRYDAEGGMPLIIGAKTAASGFDFLLLQKYNLPVEPKTKAKTK